MLVVPIDDLKRKQTNKIYHTNGDKHTLADSTASAGDGSAPTNRYDVNHDGAVDVGDVNTVLADILATGGTTLEYDVNGDGKVDVGDVNSILDAILGQ